MKSAYTGAIPDRYKVHEKLPAKLPAGVPAPMPERTCARCGRRGRGAPDVAAEETREIQWSCQHGEWRCLTCHLRR